MRVSDIYEQLAKLPVESYGAQCILSEIAELTIHDTMVYVKPYDPTQVDYLETVPLRPHSWVGLLLPPCASPNNI